MTAVQIYTMQTPEEALAVASLGVDHVGITPSGRGLPGEIDEPTARAIVDAVGGAATVVALSVEADPAACVRMVETVGPDILHLCGSPGVIGPDEVSRIRTEIAPVRVMQAISVDGPRAVDLALSYAAVSDLLILDTETDEVEGVGASGAVHDWVVSGEIVHRVDVPVVLAGGLSPENVAEAVHIVGPWGVDSLTHTNRRLPGGGFAKDLDRVAVFVSGARDG